MVINFTKRLQQALENIRYQDYHQLPVHSEEQKRSDEIIGIYGDAKWKVVHLLKESYGLPTDLHNWLYFDERDEVAYFLNEAGSNALNYSDYRAPSYFHVWLGTKGFVIGIEQKGNGFDAHHVHRKRIKDNEGAAFDFYRKCRSSVFFDDPKNARIVFMEYILPQDISTR